MRFRIFILCLSLLTCFHVQARTADGHTQAPGQPQSTPPAGDQSKTPKIDHMKPDSAAAGSTVAIEGTAFGEQGTVIFGTEPGSTQAAGTQPAGTQLVGTQKGTVVSWEDGLILVTVPNEISLGKKSVVVTNKAGASDTYKDKFEVKAPEYDKSSFEILTGVGASFLPVAGTSYKVDTTNNALSQTNVGRKHVELLLGGGFILPFKPWKRTDDPDYKNFRPLEAFLSVRFAPGADQTFTGFVIGGGYRIHKYFTALAGYSLTPMDEPTSGFRRAAAQTVAANPTIFPYNHYNASDLAHNKVGAFDGFPLFLYNASGVTTTKIFPTSPTVTHARSGIFFGVGIPVNLSSLLKPSSSK